MEKITKPSYFLFLLILSTILFQFLSCSTEPTAPDQPEVNTTVITGKVNELTQSGSAPLTNCKVFLIATNTTTISYTDSVGVFLDTLVTSEASFRLKIEKTGFSTIDTLLQINQVNSLSFTMNVSNAFISGSVIENTISGSQPSDSWKISIITSTKTTLFYTDSNGNFSSDISTTDITFRLLLEKDGYYTIDTTIQSSAAQNLDFTINYDRIEVSGRLFKVDSSGTFSFPNCEMKIYSGGVENIVQSDDNGYFKLITETFESNVKITIDKNLYTKIDTIVAIQNSVDLELTLTELVYYFPLVVGSNWIYNGVW
jgi:hypothetical protein